MQGDYLPGWAKLIESSGVSVLSRAWMKKKCTMYGGMPRKKGTWFS